jgi:surface antigen
MLSSPILQSCAVVNTAAAVSRAVVSSSNAVTRTVSAGTDAVVRSVQRIPTSMMYNTAPRRVVIPARNTAQARPATRARAPVAAKQKPTPPRKMTKERSEILEVLPPDLLDQLTQDQIILQSIIQLDALDGPGNETVFWELEGRAGTAFADQPTRTGSFTCRLITETLKLDDSGEATEAKATACKTENTSWTLSF